MRDAEWIAQLLECGLVRPSFVPPPHIRRVRLELERDGIPTTRYRQMVMGDRIRDAGRLEKLLEDASIKISAVASNILGASCRQMLAALVAGERDPALIADLAYSRLRRKIPELTEALTGRFDDHHALLVAQLLTRLDAIEATLARPDAAIAAELEPYAEHIALLQTIPGVGPVCAQVIIAETGGD